MKQLIFSIVLIIVLDALLSNCANPKTPTGGPQDSIPPVLVNAIPPNKAVNVRAQELELEFDEWISAEKLLQNLIITPQLDIKYKTLIKKNRLIIKFEKAFPDSTTITLNFFDGITDITEKNPAINLIYVFSTGSYLDSLTISGKVSNLFNQTPTEKITIGLFSYTDSLDIFKSKPMYFTSSSKEGRFSISNIKNGKYKLVAFKDDNRNLLFDASTELYAFKSGIIFLDSAISNIDLKAVKINATTLKKLSSKSNGKYFDVRYSKPLNTITSETDLPFHLLADRTTIRYYQPASYTYGDSLQVIQQVYDSLSNSLTDTLFVKFNESVRKPSLFDVKITPATKTIDTEHQYTLDFTKPVTAFNQSLISWKKDSTYLLSLDSMATLQWNNTKTQLKIKHKFDTTAYFNFQREQLALKDSSTNDTTSISTNKGRVEKISKNISFTLEKGAFLSAENDTLKTLSQPVGFLTKGQTGTLIINLKTIETHYTVQLINKQFQVINEFNPFLTKKITNLLPGDYGIRVLIDSNKNGIWSYGNIIKDEEPEAIFLYPGFTSLRANWEVTLDISF